MKYIRFTALLLSLALLSGCSIIPFQTPAEQRAAQQAIEDRKEEAMAQADPFAALEGNYILSRTLINSVGTTLATYQAAFPRFSQTGLKSQSFSRINNYYSNEAAGLSQDAESFFGQVKAFYGENWDTVTEATAAFSVSITSELLEAPQGYLCVRTNISVAENGQSETYPRAQVFLLDNGWKLSMETLFGNRYSEAAPLLLADILDWCDRSGIQIVGAQDLTLEDFSENFALTKDGFRFFVEPFALSNKNANRYVIPVSLDAYARMMDN